ncbi:MAG: DEAD/DEAH box helicase [Chlamydiales bacterium]
MTSCTFKSLGLNQSLLSTIEEMGFFSPTPIQQEVIPLILSGTDVVGQAQTGTGKTAAFGLPTIQMMTKRGAAQILVITPTRELASQVAEELYQFGKLDQLKVCVICGGKSFKHQIDSFNHGADILVATPGRLLDLLDSKRLTNFQPKTVILDEADEMLNMGFYEDIQEIFKYLPTERQTLLFSATMPKQIQILIKKILEKPIFVKTHSDKTTDQNIAQAYYLIEDYERDHAIIRLFEERKFIKTIIFCKTKKDVDRLSEILSKKDFRAKGLHGDMEQNQRQRVTNAFRAGEMDILVATDLAARGLNIVDVTHVVNYHIPFDVENYVHRIGRTGRAGQKGNAITFVTPKEFYRLMRYQKHIGSTLVQKFIPNKQEIRKAQIADLINKIHLQGFDENIRENLLKDLQQKMDLEILVCKMLAMVLKEKLIEGPDKIGISNDQKKHDRKKKKKNSVYPKKHKKYIKSR